MLRLKSLSGISLSLCGMSPRFIFLAQSKLLDTFDVVVTSNGAWPTGTCRPFS